MGLAKDLETMCRHTKHDYWRRHKSCVLIFADGKHSDMLLYYIYNLEAEAEEIETTLCNDFGSNTPIMISFGVLCAGLTFITNTL